MRINHLQLTNFSGFAQREFVFHPQFNLIVGENGSGKTSLLNALAVAAGSWFLGMTGSESRSIRSAEIRLVCFQQADGFYWEQQFPCEVAARGTILGQPLVWQRAVQHGGGRTKAVGAGGIKSLARTTDAAVRRGEGISLPLISYYGTGRLWLEPKESYQVNSGADVANKTNTSRFFAYSNSIDPRLSVVELSRYFAHQTWIAFQYPNKQFPGFAAVKQALTACIEGASSVEFDPRRGEVVVQLPNGMQPFSNLSDGQRCMLALIGDIAQKAIRLNPHLGGRALQETEGIVMIDELDLHLHPLWQRRVVEDLRTTFPGIQFICTTHSPFLIQSLRSGEELLMLTGQSCAELGNLSLVDIAQGIQGVVNPEVGLRYIEMKKVARYYLETLERARLSPPEKLSAFTEQLAKSIGPYADNPAFQAFLEMKRIVRLGE